MVINLLQIQSNASWGTTQEMMESAKEWASEYDSIDHGGHLCRRWKEAQDNSFPIDILCGLPDAQKPHLPEGYIWCFYKNQLSILKHRHAPISQFMIHLFGPDKKGRIQYIVEKEQDVPIHGFAMTKREGFPKELRDEYPMSLESFKAEDKAYWRGHIISYQETLGNPDEKNISTRFSGNYKPEPPVFWARNLRDYLVGHIRGHEGAYGELMLNGYAPQMTNGKRPIPEAVIMEEFNYGKESLRSFYIPKDSPCHSWSADGRRNFSEKALNSLQQSDQFPALVWHKDSPPVQSEENISLEPEKLDVQEAYQLARRAEMEYDQATCKLQYLIYGSTHQAPLEVLQFWLVRCTETAIKIDTIYHSMRPAFPQALMNSLPKDFLESYPQFTKCVMELSSVALRIIGACSKMDFPILKESKPIPKKPVPIDPLPKIEKDIPIVATIPLQKTKKAELQSPLSLRVICLSVDLQNQAKIKNKMAEITEAIMQGSSINFKEVTTAQANTFFPKIQETILKISPGNSPIQSVDIKSERWKKSVTKLGRELFGDHTQIIAPKAAVAIENNAPAPSLPIPSPLQTEGLSFSLPVKVIYLSACQSSATKTEAKMIEIAQAIAQNYWIDLKDVITEQANKFFPLIRKAIAGRSSNPIRRVYIKSERWETKVTELTREHLGDKVEIIVNREIPLLD